MKKVLVLMVCRHNICSSPMVEGILRNHLKQAGLHKKVKVNSAGTHGDGEGHRVDERARKVAISQGVDLKKHRSRRINLKDFEKFDRIYAMDQANYVDLQGMCPPEFCHKLKLVMSCADNAMYPEVPDPYYGGLGGFQEVFVLLDNAMSGLINQLLYDLDS